ncbi:AraC family transcriptional regulator [Hydrogenophaga taeniospiralis CCUG 15921]|uniref:AraC family transcriptional regulator n=1 Tax=Hydrogenophaga taeniospiralis CCUG 15921 TaxID=1281780 RepID=A0A9X4NU96_9BURK|nr:AraC family transcriptional regulator [Hydrogenophaga taeniospiralis CCUG 15921]
MPGAGQPPPRYDAQVTTTTAAAASATSARPSTTRTPGVFEVLSRSRARLERSALLGDALLLAQWHNELDRPSYQQPGHHTLSVYLEGGQGTRLVGSAGEPGAPGLHCVLPAEHESHWQVEQPFRFLHLYLSEQAWADRVVRLLDAEPRAHTLEPCIFGADPALAGWAQAVAGLDWSDASARLRANAWSQQALDRLVLRAARPRARAAAQRPLGGLSTAVRRRVLEHIDAHLDGARTRSRWVAWPLWPICPSSTSRACFASPWAAACWAGSSSAAWPAPRPCWRPGGCRWRRWRWTAGWAAPAI